MIKYGLKLWTNNETLFKQAIILFTEKKIDFIELYHNPGSALDFKKLAQLKKIPVMIHAPHSHGFHELVILDAQYRLWQKTIELADFFQSQYIIVHPGWHHNIKTFRQNLRKIDDKRILIENMAGMDISHQIIEFGQYLTDLKSINKKKNICFDIEKAVKAACYQKIDYKKFIEQSIHELAPSYFHLSGGDITSPLDQHFNLWESNIDFAWLKIMLEKLAKEKIIHLVLETPKADGLENDLKNINYFKNSSL